MVYGWHFDIYIPQPLLIQHDKKQEHPLQLIPPVETSVVSSSLRSSAGSPVPGKPVRMQVFGVLSILMGHTFTPLIHTYNSVSHHQGLTTQSTSEHIQIQTQDTFSDFPCEATPLRTNKKGTFGLKTNMNIHDYSCMSWSSNHLPMSGLIGFAGLQHVIPQGRLRAASGRVCPKRKTTSWDRKALICWFLFGTKRFIHRIDTSLLENWIDFLKQQWHYKQESLLVKASDRQGLSTLAEGPRGSPPSDDICNVCLLNMCE